MEALLPATDDYRRSTEATADELAEFDEDRYDFDPRDYIGYDERDYEAEHEYMQELAYDAMMDRAAREGLL